jgi:hypothetical protein
MKISDHIKYSLDACDSRELDKAMLFACLAVDGIAKKMYPEIPQVGTRFRKFITEHIDVIEIMFGGIDLENTVFPLKNSKGKDGVKFEDIVYEKVRCSLAHGDELPEDCGITVKVEEGIQQFFISIKPQMMMLPESAIYALGLSCMLASVNADQKIGSNLYYYRDSINTFVIDRWWGKIECARQVMDFDNQVKVKMEFSQTQQTR